MNMQQLSAEIKDLRTEMNSRFDELGKEMKAGFERLDIKLDRQGDLLKQQGDLLKDVAKVVLQEGQPTP